MLIRSTIREWTDHAGRVRQVQVTTTANSRVTHVITDWRAISGDDLGRWQRSRDRITRAGSHRAAA